MMGQGAKYKQLRGSSKSKISPRGLGGSSAMKADVVQDPVLKAASGQDGNNPEEAPATKTTINKKLPTQPETGQPPKAKTLQEVLAQEQEDKQKAGQEEAKQKEKEAKQNRTLKEAFQRVSDARKNNDETLMNTGDEDVIQAQQEILAAEKQFAQRNQNNSAPLTEEEMQEYYQDRAKRWEPEIHGQVIEKMGDRVKPLVSPQPELQGSLDKEGLNQYIGNDWATTSLKDIQALRKTLGIKDHNPPSGVIAALQDQPLSQRLYTVAAEKPDHDDNSLLSLTELFSDPDIEDKILSPKDLNNILQDFQDKDYGTKDLNNGEKLALYMYTKSSWTDKVNGYLRQIDSTISTIARQKKEGASTAEAEKELQKLMSDPGFKQTRQVTTLMMDALGKLIARQQKEKDKTFMVTRGAGAQHFDVKKNDIIYDAAFTSTSDAPSHQSQFAKASDVQMLLFSNQGIDVSKISGFQKEATEDEILMFPGTMFHVDTILTPEELYSGGRKEQLIVGREFSNDAPINMATTQLQGVQKWKQSPFKGQKYDPAEVRDMLRKKYEQATKDQEPKKTPKKGWTDYLMGLFGRK